MGYKNMFSKFKYETISLEKIMLDERNPRIVSSSKLSTQEEILEYFFEHEELLSFIKKIASEGRNDGSERPYIIKKGTGYVVLEGNTRIAAYKILTGLMKAPKQYSSLIPSISKAFSEKLKYVDCTLAPDRDSLLPIMAKSHFGIGDKSKWGYLGSRKAVYEEHKSGRSITELSRVFGISQSEIKSYILEYLLYLEALKFKWTDKERAVLLDPALEFNPPIRFLQTKGHKDLMGIELDKTNLEIVFADTVAKKKFQHLLFKLVVNREVGLSAISTYKDVFSDFKERTKPSDKKDKSGHISFDKGGAKSSKEEKKAKGKSGKVEKETSADKKGKYALFSYDVKINDATLEQLMKEAKSLNCQDFPGAGTALLRSIVETLLKHIIHVQGANPGGNSIDLEKAVNICKQQSIRLANADDKKILEEFRKSHLSYLNIGVHGNSVPNKDRLFIARDCIDGFIKRNV